MTERTFEKPEENKESLTFLTNLEKLDEEINNNFDTSDPLMNLNYESILNLLLAFMMYRPDISYAPVNFLLNIYRIWAS